MDYVVGSIAALLSGNVTPNRPKPLRNAHTPMKHEPSPNVTPKSEFVDDRSVFLSPTMQKKKAIVKKSPKRIFQNPDLDLTNGEDNDSSLISPKADKVKKHLKDELEADTLAPTILMSPKSPKNNEVSPKKNKKRSSDNIVNDENSPKKKKPKSEPGTDDGIIHNGNDISNLESIENSLKKKVKKLVSAMEINDKSSLENQGNHSKKKNKQWQNEFTVEEVKFNTVVTDEINTNTSVNENQSPKKKRRNKSKQNESTGNKPNEIARESEKDSQSIKVDSNAAIIETQGPVKEKKNRKKKKSNQNKTEEQIQSTNNINPNSITQYMEVDLNSESKSENTPSTPIMDSHSPKKKNKKRNKSKQIKNNDQTEPGNVETDIVATNIEIDSNIDGSSENTSADSQNPKKKKKKSKKNKNNQQIESASNENDKVNPSSDTNKEIDLNIESKSENPAARDIHSPKKNKKQLRHDKNSKLQFEANDNVEVNPNAVTNQDTDSEHGSDDEIDSETEEVNKKELDTGPADDSSDEAPDEVTINKKGVKEEGRKFTEEEIKRTLFVGNVPFSAKTKKEIKKIFSKYGQIESVRIRTVPVKDARDTPKMAVIKRELHPDRSTVHVYVRFSTANSVQKALVENNSVLNGCHLRVHPSDSTGVPHDPKCSIFVGNIPFTLEDEALRAKFEKCGDIESVRIVRDSKTCIGKGFGYVNFKSKDGVELALALTEEDLTIKNRILRVKRCTQPTEKQLRTREYFNKPRGRDFGKKFGGGTQVGSGKKENFRRQEQGNKGNFGKGKFEQEDNRNSGAYRRVMNKRKNQESGDGPPNKRQNVDQPPKEKKERKEFVGMTAEKKKKNKFDKGQKKKKVLSEILTK